MKTAIHWLALLLVSSASTAADTQSVFDINPPAGDLPFAPWQATPRFGENVHKLQDLERLVGQDPVLSAKGSPFLQAHREQFSALDTDSGQALYARFHKVAFNSTEQPTSFTVTSDRAFGLLNYANAPGHEGHIRIRLIQHEHEETLAARSVYMPSAKKREGDGVVGTRIDFVGWQVWWRGIEFDIWQARYFEPTVYSFVIQSHIIGRSSEDAFPLDVPASLSSTAVTTSSAAANLLILEVAAWNSEVRNAILVFDSGYWQADGKLWDSVQKADWKDVILPAPLKTSIRHEYTSFFSSERIYKDLDVAWKRGVIMLGPPGNGKTISIKAMMRDVANGEGVGKETKRVLYVRSFHTYMGDEYGIKQVFERARQEAPCLVVFEDIDSLITDNNRSFFLNEVDGLEDNDGLLMVATTNHFDRLDPALSNRPSRTFPDPVKAERRQYAVYWQKKLAENERIKFPNKLLDDFAAKTDGFSFAYMKEAFVSALLILAGDETNSLTFPHELMAQVATLRKELDSGKSVWK